MFKAIIKVSLLLFTLLYLASSCNETIADPAVTLNQIIENKSDLDLLLTILMTNNIDSIRIQSRQEYIVSEVNTIGSIGGFQDCETENLLQLSLKVESSDSLIVNIDPKQSSNWLFTILNESSNGGGAGECRLVIEDHNIQ